MLDGDYDIAMKLCEYPLHETIFISNITNSCFCCCVTYKTVMNPIHNLQVKMIVFEFLFSKIHMIPKHKDTPAFHL